MTRAQDPDRRGQPRQHEAVPHAAHAAGHQVVGLNGGDGLLDTIAREQPAVALMDIQLPGKDGFALLAEIRRSPHAGLLVLALTAHAMQGDRERALEAGFDGYITKPVDIRSFPEQVQQAITGRPTP